MPQIITRGCISTCGYCRTEFSFVPNEVAHSTTPVRAGYSPEEEASDKAVYSVRCPNCRRSVDVGEKLGSAAKRELASRPKHYDD